MEGFKLKIVTPYKVVLDENVNRITLKGYSGEFTILEDFQNFITATMPGIISIELLNKEEVEYFATGGIVEVKNGIVTLCTSTIESDTEIDLERAKMSLERATERLNKQENLDNVRAKLALDRAIERINLAKKRKR